jgi:serine/threonine protein kinase
MLTDFSSARFITKPSKKLKSQTWPNYPQYTATERVTMKEYDEKIDIFSFGLTLVNFFKYGYFEPFSDWEINVDKEVRVQQERKKKTNKLTDSFVSITRWL